MSSYRSLSPALTHASNLAEREALASQFTTPMPRTMGNSARLELLGLRTASATVDEQAAPTRVSGADALLNAGLMGTPAAALADRDLISRYVSQSEGDLCAGIDGLETEADALVDLLACGGVQATGGDPLTTLALTKFATDMHAGLEVANGFAKGAVGMGGGLAQLLIQPEDALLGVAGMLEHLPGPAGFVMNGWHHAYNVASGQETLGEGLNATYNPAQIVADDYDYWSNMAAAVAAPYRQNIADGRYGEALGRAGFEIVSNLVCPGAREAPPNTLRAATEGADLNRVAEVSDLRALDNAATAEKVTKEAGVGAEVAGVTDNGLAVEAQTWDSARPASKVHPLDRALVEPPPGELTPKVLGYAATRDAAKLKESGWCPNAQGRVAASRAHILSTANLRETVAEIRVNSKNGPTWEQAWEESAHVHALLSGGDRIITHKKLPPELWSQALLHEQTHIHMPSGLRTAETLPLNEGITQYLTERLDNTRVDAYADEVEAVREMVAVGGETGIKQMLASGDLNDLWNRLDAVSPGLSDHFKAKFGIK